MEKSAKTNFKVASKNEIINENFQSKVNTTNWEFSFYKMTPVKLEDPYGFNVPIIDSSNANTNLPEKIAKMKANKAQELAYGQFKSIFMTMISFYFIGANLSLFTIFIVGLYGYNNLSSILNVNNVFKPFENHMYTIFHYKLIYCFIQSISFTFILYRIYGMGLIPLNPADWIAFIDNAIAVKTLIN